MPLGLYDRDRRYRSRVWSTLTRVGFYLVTLGAVSAFAYQIGVERTRQDEASLMEYIHELETTNADLQREKIEADAAAQTARARQDELLRQLSQIEVPTEQQKYFYGLIAGKLAEGVNPDRLALYIGAAGEPHDCTNPSTKRFILPTATVAADDSSAKFADGRIVVSGMGTNARGADGTEFNWFDPLQPVRIDFATNDGRQSAATGVLPIRHSVVLGNKEHRFTIVAGDRSFVEVTAEQCAFP